MYSVSDQLYAEVTARLRAAIGDKGYFSGSVDGETDEVAWRLTASVLVLSLIHISEPTRRP